MWGLKQKYPSAKATHLIRSTSGLVNLTLAEVVAL